MIIDLTCYPLGGDDAEVPSVEDAAAVLGIAPPEGWPPLKVLTDVHGYVRASDFPSTVLLLVYAKGGPSLPDLPKLEDLAHGKVVWRNLAVMWDSASGRLLIAELGKGDAPVS